MAIEKIMDFKLLDSGEGDILITTNDLAAALGVAPATIRSLVFRNDYLDDPEFSFRADLRGHPRIFTEDSVYQILMLMKANERAKEFRRWLRGIVKQLRRGETKVINTESGEPVLDTSDVAQKLGWLVNSIASLKQILALQEEQMSHHDKLIERLNSKIDALNIRSGGEDELRFNS